MAKRRRSPVPAVTGVADYDRLIAGISELLEQARRATARAVNSVLTATYWDIGRRIVEFEQGGQGRAGYGEATLKRLAADLAPRLGRGFSWRNLFNMRAFYLGWEVGPGAPGRWTARVRAAEAPPGEILQTPSAISPAPVKATAFPLSWSHYVRLLAVDSPGARAFYEDEAVRGGWSFRQLDRQINSQLYERTALSRNKAKVLTEGRKPKPGDAVSPRDEIRDPYVLEFLDLKDEYSETDLEEALIRHLEAFLLELGTGFTFVARQKRLRIDDEWYRIDLLLFHRVLRCLVVIDLKTGKFTHADAGQMSLYLNYAREHMMLPGEGDPVGLILCREKSDAVVRYATGGINAQVFASKYLTRLPDEETLRREILETQRQLEAHARPGGAARPGED